MAGIPAQVRELAGGAEVRPIPDFPGYYVTRDGRIISIRGRFGIPTPRVLKTSVDHDGYHKVTLMRDGKKQNSRKAHLYVADAFLPPAPFEGAVVRHWDGNPNNNDASNLVWGSQLENHQDRERHRRTARGERLSKLTEDDAREIKRRLAAGEIARSIAEDYGVSRRLISDIKIGKAWGWLNG